VVAASSGQSLCVAIFSYWPTSVAEFSSCPFFWLPFFRYLFSVAVISEINFRCPFIQHLVFIAEFWAAQFLVAVFTYYL